ncbi:MAG TPA: hypothetical protein VG146_21810 [Verrucomicrobiae bacterium]|nr:hypothetical protein [Verrucomicrobiae bacterium]
MVIHRRRFNIYLLVALQAALLCGCKTGQSEAKKQLGTLRVYEEVNPDPMGHSQEVAIYREHPSSLTVSKEPFLNEVHVKEAKVIDVVGGFALRIKFDREGSWLLEQYTSADRGRHLAMFSQFYEPSEKKLNAGRWLAAPLITNHITDGVLIFTPDATREEAEQIARGLNNVAKKLENADTF